MPELTSLALLDFKFSLQASTTTTTTTHHSFSILYFLVLRYTRINLTLFPPTLFPDPAHGPPASERSSKYEHIDEYECADSDRARETATVNEGAYERIEDKDFFANFLSIDKKAVGIIDWKKYDDLFGESGSGKERAMGRRRSARKTVESAVKSAAEQEVCFEFDISFASFVQS